MKILTADSMTIEFTPEALRGVDEVFNSVLYREASQPGLVDALLFLLLMKKAEQDNPGTAAAMMNALRELKGPEVI